MPDMRNMDYYMKTKREESELAQLNESFLNKDLPAGTPMHERIAAKCDEIKALLVEKNKKYGNSAIQPLRIFSRSSPIEGILVRCDDKLSRIRETGIRNDGEDQVLDLIGYLVLLSIHNEI